jgi:hypothetical protein
MKFQYKALTYKVLVVTIAYCHLLADVHLADVAPAFTFSQCDSEFSRKPPNALSLSRWQQAEKKKKDRNTVQILTLLRINNNKNRK